MPKPAAIHDHELPTAAPLPFHPVEREEDILLPEQTDDVVEREGSAPTTGGQRHGQIIAWLLAPEREPSEVPLAEVPRLVRSEDNFVWVQLWDYTEADLRSLADRLELRQEAVEVALGPWVPPRVDVDGGVYVVMATLPQIDEAAHRVYAAQAHLFVDPRFLVTVHHEPPVLSQKALERARKASALVRQDTSFLVYLILDELLAYYEDLNRHVDDEIEAIEERALTDTSDEYLEDLLRLKRYAFAIARLADQHRGVFAAFLQPDFPFELAERMRPYFQDLEERFQHLVASLTASKEAVNGAFDIYVSHVAHRTNGVMKVLTVITGFLLPASLVLALGSALAEVTGQFAIVGAILLAAGVLLATVASLWVFRHRGWM